MWKYLMLCFFITGCGGSISSGNLGPLPLCPKETIWTSTRGQDGIESLACLKKCWMDQQCAGDDGRCLDSVCVHALCLHISGQTTCIADPNCYWHKSTNIQDLSRCSSGYNAIIN